MADDGCLSSAAGLQSAAALADDLGIELKLEPIKAPFLHCFGSESNSAEGAWAAAEWRFPMRFINGAAKRMQIACALGGDPTLIGCDFLGHRGLPNPENKITWKGNEANAPMATDI